MSVAKPSPAPACADEAARTRAETLLEAWSAWRADPDGTEGADRLEAARRALRQGPLLHPGEIVCDRFRLLARLRDGTLATTWKGWDLERGEPVAVKVLQARFTADPALVEHFFAAAERLAALELRHVPAVRLPRGDFEGFQLFVTDLHGERSLEARIGELDRWQAVQAVLDVGRALSDAHAAGLFHRDVHPGAIFVDDEGSPWLVDFDLAPPSALQMGSPYQAPEAMEPGAEPTGAADVFGLAMTLLFALHGRALPYWVIRDPERLIAGVEAPEAVRDALRAATSWDPAERTASVDLLRDAILAPIEVLSALAEAALSGGRADVAADHYWELVARGEGHPDLRVGLARALAARGEEEEASNQLMLALQDDRLEAIDETLAELRTLSERTGDWAPLVDALEARADDPRSPRDALLLEVARIQSAHDDDPAAAVAAWQRALDVHTTRAQARGALEGLLRIYEGRGSWEAFAGTARDLLPLLPRSERAALQHRLGRVHLEHLDDQQGGLVWLERAHDSGFTHPDLAPTLERLRSARGDWPEVIALMEEQARDREPAEAIPTLRRAARTARYASQDAARTARLYGLLVEAAPGDEEASSWLAAQAVADGDHFAALAALAHLPPDPGEELARWLADVALVAPLLVEADQVEEAQTLVEAALRAAPAHLPSLRLAARLRAEEGALPEAEDLWERMLAVVIGAGLPEVEAEARSALVDLAWIHGDLERAARHAHALAALRPDDPSAWWAVSKVALWALRTASDEVAWLRATPLRFTPQEALARLLGGTVAGDAMLAWMGGDPLGRALAARLGGRPAVEVAAVAVDLLLRRGLVGPGLFERLGEAYPEAGVSVEAVRWLWCEDPTDHLFPVAESYRWADTAADFDPRIHRQVLHHVPPLTGDAPAPQGSSGALHEPAAWEALLRRDQPGPLPIEGSSPSPSDATPQLALERPRRLVLQLDRPVGGSYNRVIEGEVTELSEELGLDEVRPGVTLHRYGSRVYLVGPATVDGRQVEEARLIGGERVRVGELDFRVHLLEGHEELPPEPRQRPTVMPSPASPASDGEHIDEAPIAAIPAPEEDPERTGPRARVRNGTLEDDLDLGEFIAQEDDPTAELREPPPALPRAAVFVRRGGADEMVPFDHDLFIVGRNPADDVFVEEPGVGFAFRLHHRSEGYTIEEALPDGTSEERPLRDGDVFSIGEVACTFRILEAERGRTPAPPPLRAPAPSLAPVPLLMLDDGSDEGKLIPVRRDTFTIGRGRKNDLQLAGDAKISRHHAILVRSADGVVKLRDNSSSNGTFVNGRKVREHILQVGDAIAIGDHLFEFRLGRSDDENDVELNVYDEELPVEREDSQRTRHPTELIRIDDLHGRT